MNRKMQPNAIADSESIWLCDRSKYNTEELMGLIRVLDRIKNPLEFREQLEKDIKFMESKSIFDPNVCLLSEMPEIIDNKQLFKDVELLKSVPLKLKFIAELELRFIINKSSPLKI